MTVHQNTRNRRNGAKFENDLVARFRAEGFDTERLRLSGTQDEGDLVVRSGARRWVVEAKSGKNLSVRRWWDEESTVEAKHFANRRGLEYDEAPPALILKSHNKSIGKALVVIDLEMFVHLLQEGSK